jgi:hypothetical protein
MPYLYLDDIATADAAFEAKQKTLQELVRAATEVTMSVRVAGELGDGYWFIEIDRPTTRTSFPIRSFRPFHRDHPCESVP